MFRPDRIGQHFRILELDHVGHEGHAHGEMQQTSMGGSPTLRPLAKGRIQLVGVSAP